MALKRIVGTAVRHPLATTGMVLGVAKGTLGVVQRLVRHDNPGSSTDEGVPQESSTAPEAAVATETVREPEVVLIEPEDRDLPEPIVIEAVDEPEPAIDPEGHVELEEELVWTSESEGRPE
jgi:hypothetical protein